MTTVTITEETQQDAECPAILLGRHGSFFYDALLESIFSSKRIDSAEISYKSGTLTVEATAIHSVSTMTAVAGRLDRALNKAIKEHGNLINISVGPKDYTFEAISSKCKHEQDDKLGSPTCTTHYRAVLTINLPTPLKQ